MRKNAETRDGFRQALARYQRRGLRRGFAAGLSRSIRGFSVPDQVNRQVSPRRTLPTTAGRKHARLVPPLRRTLGYTTPTDPASSSLSASHCEAT